MNRPGFTFCTCPDSYLIKNHIGTLLQNNAPESGTWHRQAFWGDDQLPPAFWENLTLQGLFGTPQALVVRNAHNIPADTWKKISAAIARPNALAWPFFCLEVAFERGKPKIPAHIQKLPCFQFAMKKQWVWTMPGLDAREKRIFIQQQCRDFAIKLAPQTLDKLALALPDDATAIVCEIKKLALALPTGGQITPEMTQLVSHTPDIDIFTFIKALQQSNASTVWREVFRSQETGDALLFPFLGMLMREARQLWQLLSGEEVKLPTTILSAKQQLARQIGYAGLTRIWELALEAERGVKTGERSLDQAMDALVAGLSHIFTVQCSTSRR